MNKCFVVALPEETGSITKIEDYPVFYSNIGKLNSSILIHELIDKGFREIVNIGSCGSKKHKLGELLKVGKLYQDIDVTPIYKYGTTSPTEDSDCVIIDNESDITCFSTDYFYDHNQESKYSNFYLNSLETYSIFDMESFAQGKICELKKIKYSSYKWVSDDGDFEKWLHNCKIGFKKFYTQYFK